MNNVCPICNQTFSNMQGAACSVCNISYHISCEQINDAVCLEIPNGFTEWQCSTCRQKSITRQSENTIEGNVTAQCTDVEGPSKLDSVIASLSSQLKQLNDGHEATSRVIHEMLSHVTAFQEIMDQMKEQSNRVKKVETQTNRLEAQIHTLAERMNQFEHGENATVRNFNQDLNGIPNQPNGDLEKLVIDIGTIIDTYKNKIQSGNRFQSTRQNKPINEDFQNTRAAESESTGDKDNKVVNIEESIIGTLDAEAERKTERKTERDVEQKARRARYFKMEENLLSIDYKIKSCLQLHSADVDRTIKLLHTYKESNFTKYLLLKHPNLVETIKGMRRYIGNTKKWQFTDDQAKEFNEKAANIRNLAESIYERFRSSFVVPNGSTFLKVFNDEVQLFKGKVSHLTCTELKNYVDDRDMS